MCVETKYLKIALKNLSWKNFLRSKKKMESQNISKNRPNPRGKKDFGIVGALSIHPNKVFDLHRRWFDAQTTFCSPWKIVH